MSSSSSSNSSANGSSQRRKRKEPEERKVLSTSDNEDSDQDDDVAVKKQKAMSGEEADRRLAELRAISSGSKDADEKAKSKPKPELEDPFFGLLQELRVISTPEQKGIGSPSSSSSSSSSSSNSSSSSSSSSASPDRPSSPGYVNPSEAISERRCRKLCQDLFGFFPQAPNAVCEILQFAHPYTRWILRPEIPHDRHLPSFTASLATIHEPILLHSMGCLVKPYFERSDWIGDINMWEVAILDNNLVFVNWMVAGGVIISDARLAEKVMKPVVQLCLIHRRVEVLRLFLAGVCSINYLMSAIACLGHPFNHNTRKTHTLADGAEETHALIDVLCARSVSPVDAYIMAWEAVGSGMPLTRQWLLDNRMEEDPTLNRSPYAPGYFKTSSPAYSPLTPLSEAEDDDGNGGAYPGLVSGI